MLRALGPFALPFAMFIGSFSWLFVCVSLPFHIQHISTWDPASTLRWTGWILGVTSLVTVVAAPLWGRFAGLGNPRRLFMVVQVLFIAPVFSIAVAGIAHRAGGQAIGAINSARIGAAFIGPVLATTVLALAPPWVLYLVLAALGFAAVPVAMWRRPASPSGA